MTDQEDSEWSWPHSEEDDASTDQHSGDTDADTNARVSSDDRSTRERLYTVLLETTTSMQAQAFAEQVDCHPSTARTYLDWFADIGIATRHDGRPVTYEANLSYLHWRAITELVEDHSLPEINTELRSITDEIQQYRSRYDANHPSLVDAHEVEGATRALEDIWDDLDRWLALEEELRLYERARQRLAEQHPSRDQLVVQ